MRIIINEMTTKEERDEQANGLADFENICAWISDSKRDFNGLLDPAIAVDCGFIYFWTRILAFAGN